MRFWTWNPPPNGVRPPDLDRLEGRGDVLCSLYSRCDDLKAELAGCGLCLAHLQRGLGKADIGQDRQSAQTGDNLAQKIDLLASKIGVLVRQAGDIATRARQARDEAGPEGVVEM